VELKGGLVGWEGVDGLGVGRDRCNEGEGRAACEGQQRRDKTELLVAYFDPEYGQQLLSTDADAEPMC
jgi:hypothetical protein